MNPITGLAALASIFPDVPYLPDFFGRSYGDMRKHVIRYRVPDKYAGKERPWRQTNITGKQWRRMVKEQRRRSK